MRMNYKSLFAAVPCILSVGCASIVSSPNRPVAITSNPLGASFVVKKENGMAVSSGVTPSTITLNSSEGYFRPAKYVVDFTKGKQTQSVPLTATMNGWYVGNILFGGLIGLLIVDPATGAMWKLDDTVIANFSHTTGIEVGNDGFVVCSIDQVPMEFRGHLKPYKRG